MFQCNDTINQLTGDPQEACLGVRLHIHTTNEHGTYLPISTLKADLHNPNLNASCSSIINQSLKHFMCQ